MKADGTQTLMRALGKDGKDDMFRVCLSASKALMTLSVGKGPLKATSSSCILWINANADKNLMLSASVNSINSPCISVTSINLRSYAFSSISPRNRRNDLLITLKYRMKSGE